MADDQLIDDGTLDAWQEIARRDDWHMRLVGSDIRMLIGDLRRARHRLAHTARLDAGDEVDRVIHKSAYAIQVLDERYTNGPAPGHIGQLAERDGWLWQAGKFLLERLRDHEVRITSDEDAREWYGHVTPAIERFRAAIAAMREGVDRGTVERIEKVSHEAHLHMVQLACLSTFDADEMDEEPSSFRELPESLAVLFNDTFGEMRDIAAALSRKGG